MTRAEGPVEQSVLAALPASFKAVRREADGALLRYLEGGAADGPTIVLLHGRGASASSWFPLLPTLARAHRVVAIDLPGFGCSEPRPGPLASSFEEGVAFFARPVEALLLEIAPEPALVAGHSLGGFVTLELALRKRVLPKAIALVGAMGLGGAMRAPARAFFRVGPERIGRRIGEKLLKKIVGFDASETGEKLAALTHELYTVKGGRPAASRAFDVLCPLVGALPNRRARLGEVDVPTLILWGERDEVFPPSVARDAAKLLRRCELVVEPCGHGPQYDAPDRVAELFASLVK